MTAIILNGTSSSGKTSIARSLQKQSKTPVLHAPLDTFVDMFDWPSIEESDRRECHALGISNFHKCLPNLASNRFDLVVDHVFEKMEWHEACFRALEGQRIFFVGVHCPLAILEERERQRGDRRIGLARGQFDKVHENKNYDLLVETSLMTPDECASKILDQI
ncbi:MAG: chloramphenicol phosphotransferase [Verrucomicrobiota bacterium]